MVGPAPSPRMVQERLGAIKKDVTSTGLVSGDFKLPCTNLKNGMQATSSAPTTGANTGPITHQNPTPTTPAKTPKTSKRKATNHIDTDDHQTIDANTTTDSDSESLPQMDETPSRSTKRQRRILPERATRAAVTNAYVVSVDDNDASGKVPDAGEVEEDSQDEYTPSKARREQEAKEARLQRLRRSYPWLHLEKK